MAQKKAKKPQALENVEQTLTKTEKYLEDNYRVLLKWLALIVGIAILIWFGRFLLNKRDAEAHSEMYQAERYFEIDSMALAINGDGNYRGFLEIISDYRLTRAANLAKYYTGIAYLRLGDYNSAIEYLEKYKIRDKVLGATATGAIGDAWVELGDLGKGGKYYMEAADYSENDFLTPVFLMKAAQVFESEGLYDKAVDAYTRIRNDYPLSTEGSSAEKHIARVRLLMK